MFCDALEALHKKGLIHGGMSLDQFIVCADGSFRLDMTTDQSAIQYPGYAPPEAYHGRSVQDCQSDIYSLAAILYRISTGLKPVESLERIVNGQDTLRPPFDMNSILPKTFNKVIMRGMALSKGNRYQTMAGFKEALIGGSRGGFVLDLKNKRKISILGDSISTYMDYNPERHEVYYNPTGYEVYYNPVLASMNGMKSVEDTWWMRVIHHLSGDLLINNSYSGSRVSGGEFPSAICEERLQNLRKGDQMPDIILVYMGYNDWGYGVRLKKKFGKKEDVDAFEYSYSYLLQKLKQMYPNAVIICGTLVQTMIRDEKDWKFPEMYGGISFNEYNQMIRKICKKQKCLLADLNKFGMPYETLDGSHPTKQGHETIAELWISCLEEMGDIYEAGQM